MDRQGKDTIRTWFTEYVRTFKTGEAAFQRNIILKEEHSLRVCNEIVDLGRSLGLGDEELCLAETIGLLHDIGRFEQFKRYRTFVDRNSEDHAQLGVQVLKQNGVLDFLDAATRGLIVRAVSYHNRAELPEQESEECLFFSRLLRDADKLDIWKVVTDYYGSKDGVKNDALEYGLPDTGEISRAVYRDLSGGRMVDIGSLETLNDFKLLQIGWLYDINFGPTFQHIKQRYYLETIFDSLPPSDKLDRLYGTVKTYLDKKVEEARKAFCETQTGA